MKDIYHI